MVTKLLQRGADARATDESQRSPLHFTVRKGHVAVTEKLLEYGASPLQEDHLGSAPISIAINNKNDEMSALLLKYTDDTA